MSLHAAQHERYEPSAIFVFHFHLLVVLFLGYLDVISEIIENVWESTLTQYMTRA